MLEKTLTQEMHRVADAAPVPADLFPRSLKAARRRAPRRLVMAVAAAAAALVLFAATPLGGRVMATVGQYIMHYTVQVIHSESPETELPFLRADTIGPGQTVVKEPTVPGHPRQVGTGMTLAELQQADPSMPLPTYLAPGADTRIVKLENFRPDSGDLYQRGYTLWWSVPGADRPHMVSYSLWRNMGEGQLPQAGQPALTFYTTEQGARAGQKVVTIKGQEATATKVGKQWNLMWYNKQVGGFLTSTLPLEELLKVAESLPSLE